MPSKEAEDIPAGVRLPPKHVRCLGPREADHWFWNDGTDAHRTCPDCRRRQDELAVSGQFERVIRDPSLER